MEQPLGFVAQGKNGKACRLCKSLDGLKHSPQAWFGKFIKVIESFGMQKSTLDHSIFFKRSESGVILIVVYVDAIVVVGDDALDVQSLKTFLYCQFQIKDLNMLKYLLGI